MYDTATSVHVVEAKENLLRDLLDELHGHAFVLMAFNEAEQIFPQHLEYHAHVGTVGPFVLKVIEEADDMRTSGMGVRWRWGWVWV